MWERESKANNTNNINNNNNKKANECIKKNCDIPYNGIYSHFYDDVVVLVGW